MTSEEKRVCYLNGMITGRSTMFQWFTLHPDWIGYKTKQAEKDRELEGVGEWGVGSGEWGVDLEEMGHGYDRNTLYTFM